MEILLWILFGVGVLYGLDQLGLWMEAKGWIYYRKVKSRSSGADILTGSDIFNPGARHLHEAQQQRTIEEDEDDGDDDGQRKAKDRVS